jgi:hypothetical protein
VALAEHLGMTTAASVCTDIDLGCWYGDGMHCQCSGCQRAGMTDNPGGRSRPSCSALATERPDYGERTALANMHPGDVCFVLSTNDARVTMDTFRSTLLVATTGRDTAGRALTLQPLARDAV